MTGYTFKIYIADGREWFEYGETENGGWQKIKKDFPFPESLLKLLYLDIWSLEPITKRIEKSLLNLYQTKGEQYAQEVLVSLDELTSAHIYFELLRLDWCYRLQKAKRENYDDVSDLLPSKQITHIPSMIDKIQRQIIAMFDRALDLAGDRKKSVSEKMVEYYNAEGSDNLYTFQFRLQSMNFEVLDKKTFAGGCIPSLLLLLTTSTRSVSLAIKGVPYNSFFSTYR